MTDLGRQLRRSVGLQRAPSVDHAGLQRRGRRARTGIRFAGAALSIALGGVLGYGAIALLGDRAQQRVMLTQPDATAATARDLQNPSEAPAADEFAIYLDLTNQSYDEPSVRMVVSIDGRAVVDRVMETRDQHNVARFPLALRPGPHTVSVELPDGGGDATADFVVEADTWLNVTHWGPEAPIDKRIEILVSDEAFVYG